MSTDEDNQSKPRGPVDTYTAMLLLSFAALAIGCLILAIDLFGRRMPLGTP